MPYSDKDKQRRAKAEGMRRKRAAARGTPVVPALPIPVRLETALDCLALAREEVDNVRAAPEVSAPERARTVGFLLSVALRAIEAGNLAGRLEALEAALAHRPAPPRPVLPAGVAS